SSQRLGSGSRKAAVALADGLQDARHDLWQGDILNVAPARTEHAMRFRKKGVHNLSPGDLDFLMCKVLTTMGGEASFKFFLPRFLSGVVTFPDFGSWATNSHVLLSKLECINLNSWKRREQVALLAALEAFAVFEWSIEAGRIWGDPIGALAPDEGLQGLLHFVRTRREGVSEFSGQ
ncbi:MAG: hypothetical protein U0Q16_31265, partial [Bryobacteraceae bacterium]